MLLQKSKEGIIKIPAFQAGFCCAVGRLMELARWPRSFSATYLDPLVSRWSCPWSKLLAAAFIYPSCRNEESQGKDGAGTVPFCWLWNVTPAPAWPWTPQVSVASSIQPAQQLTPYPGGGAHQLWGVSQAWFRTALCHHMEQNESKDSERWAITSQWVNYLQKHHKLQNKWKKAWVGGTLSALRKLPVPQRQAGAGCASKKNLHSLKEAWETTDKTKQENK